MTNCVLDSYLREDAGCGSDSAVYHAVENGQQAVQSEGLGPQKVVTCLGDIKLHCVICETTQISIMLRSCWDGHLFIFLQELCFSYFPMMLLEGNKWMWKQTLRETLINRSHSFIIFSIFADLTTSNTIMLLTVSSLLSPYFKLSSIYRCWLCICNIPGSKLWYATIISSFVSFETFH